VHQALVVNRLVGFSNAEARLRGEQVGFTFLAMSDAQGPDDCDVAVIDAELARAFLTTLPLHRPGERLTRVVVLADTDDSTRAADLVRMGAVGWVYRGESIDVLMETIHAVLRGEVRLPQQLLDELLERADPPAAERPSVAALLTTREIQILQLLEQGMSRSEIADRLHLSPNTIRSHVQHILSRLGVHSTLAAVARMRAERISLPLVAGGTTGERR
jgi:DNA-binding NarL/FixJ family response regulator